MCVHVLQHGRTFQERTFNMGHSRLSNIQLDCGGHPSPHGTMYKFVPSLFFWMDPLVPSLKKCHTQVLTHHSWCVRDCLNHRSTGTFPSPDSTFRSSKSRNRLLLPLLGQSCFCFDPNLFYLTINTHAYLRRGTMIRGERFESVRGECVISKL